MNDLSCWETKFKSCCYSERLLKKLLLLNETATTKIDILEIKKAIYYARKYHGHQKRESGEPYYSHPIEVAYMIADYSFKPDILVTSILHDTIEDTELTKETITCIFDQNIANQVDALTRLKIDRKISSIEIIKLLWIQKNSDDLLLVKYFDRVHNILTIKAKSPEKILKIIEETLTQFISLGIYFKSKIPEILMIEEQLIQLCYQNIILKQQSPSLELILDNFQLPSLTSQNEKFQN
jgi:(p)ppGpp synthase/HD superfamily hydrolase